MMAPAPFPGPLLPSYTLPPGLDHTYKKTDPTSTLIMGILNFFRAGAGESSSALSID